MRGTGERGSGWGFYPNPSEAALPMPGAKGERVWVGVRFRPLGAEELRRGEVEQWTPLDGSHVGLRAASLGHAAAADAGVYDARYAYDRVFGGECETSSVFSDAASSAVRSAVLDGVSATVFAYGVTGSGKTYTMQGSQENPGVIPLAVRRVFSLIEDTPGASFLLRMNYLEIYNEVVNDLLDPANTNLRVREDKARGVFVEGLKEEEVVSIAHVTSLIRAGEAHRHVGATNANEYSSRSHTLFQLIIEASVLTPDGSRRRTQHSRLSLIDLAGSESSKVGTVGTRQKEGAYINKSLLTLGSVIAKLSDRSTAPQHVPYRDSKLTRLLQTPLSGKGRVVLLCTVSPASSLADETHNTLKFASRAKKVAVVAERVTIVDENSLIIKYQAEILDLRHKLELAESQRVVDADVARWDADRAVLESRITRLQKIILHSSRARQPALEPAAPLADVAASPAAPETSAALSPEVIAGQAGRPRLNSLDEADLIASLRRWYALQARFGHADTSPAEPRDRARKLHRASFSAEAPASLKSSPTMGSPGLEKKQRKGALHWARKRLGITKQQKAGATPSPQRPQLSTAPVKDAAPADDSVSPTGSFDRNQVTGTTLAGDIHIGTASSTQPRTDDEAKEELRLLRDEVTALTEQLSDRAELMSKLRSLREQCGEREERVEQVRRQLASLRAQPGGTENIELWQVVDALENETVELVQDMVERNFEAQMTAADNSVLREENARLQERLEKLERYIGFDPNAWDGEAFKDAEEADVKEGDWLMSL